MSKRVLQFSSTLQRAIAEILLLEAEDQLLKMVTVSRVEVANDLKIARIYVSSWKNNPQEVIASLERARHFLLEKISQRVICKFLPRINFYYDHGFELEERLRELTNIQQVGQGKTPLKD